MHTRITSSMTTGLPWIKWRKANMQTSKHTALKNIIKSRNGQMPSFEGFRASLHNFSDLSIEQSRDWNNSEKRKNPTKNG